MLASCAVVVSIWHIYALVQTMRNLQVITDLLANIYAALLEYDEGWEDWNGEFDGDDGAEDEREAARWN